MKHQRKIRVFIYPFFRKIDATTEVKTWFPLNVTEAYQYLPVIKNFRVPSLSPFYANFVNEKGDLIVVTCYYQKKGFKDPKKYRSQFHRWNTYKYISQEKELFRWHGMPSYVYPKYRKAGLKKYYHKLARRRRLRDILYDYQDLCTYQQTGWREEDCWACPCGNYIEDGLHCRECGREPPWGCPCEMCQHPDLDDEYYDDYISYW